MHLPDMPENSEISVRQFDDEKIKLLRGNLLDFRECLVDEGSDQLNVFDNRLIETVVQNCHYLLCEDDIIDLGLLDNELASDIIELIDEVFM